MPRTTQAAAHLEVLQRLLRGVRKRLVWVFVSGGLGMSLAGYYYKAIIGGLLSPAHGQLSTSGLPIFTSPIDMFSLVAKMVVLGGIAGAAPVLAFQVARLLGPLLDQRKRRFVALFLPAVFLCFLAGMAYAYFVLLPAGLAFLLQFGMGVAMPMIHIVEYVDLALTMMLWLGVIFELPLAMFLLVKFQIVSRRRLRKIPRRFIATAAIIFSIIITPTIDYVNMALVALPIFLLYEAGMLLAWLARPRAPTPARDYGGPDPRPLVDGWALAGL